MNKFTCVQCNQTFEKSMSDEEAMEESLQKFTKEQLEDSVVICDDCYQILLENERKHLERRRIHEEKMKTDPLYSLIVRNIKQMMIYDILGVKPVEPSPVLKEMFDEETKTRVR